jgi:type VII secretion-associated serine protease mycosin
VASRGRWCVLPSHAAAILATAVVAAVVVAAVVVATGALAVPVLAPAPAYAVAAPARAEACGPIVTRPLRDQPWPLRRLRPDLVWPLTRGAGVTVAVIDSGVSDNHPALAGRVLDGVDLVAPGSGKCDTVGHGTMIGGIIAGGPTEGSGFHGMAPDAKILPLRVLESDERSFDEEHPIRISQAIRIATDRGADVINLSLTTVPIPQLAEAIRYAVDHDVVIVAAAGNTNGAARPGQPSYPAAYDGVLGVAGIDEAGNHVSTSLPGDFVDVAAPGLQIAGPAAQGGGFDLKPNGGTSFASAYVSGVAALVRAYRPDLDAAEVIRRIVRTADRTAGGWDAFVGAGVVNPYWAVVSDAAEEEGQGPPAHVVLTPPQADPLHAVRALAAWSTLIAVVVAALVLASVSVVRRGRQRGWRPGSRAPSV